MDLKKILRDQGLKATKPRLAILGILEESERGMDAEEIHRLASGEEPLNLSTVYRTLDALVERNIIEKYDLGESKYNFLFRKDRHHHFITCQQCHKTVEMDCPIAKLEELISKETGFAIVDHHLELKGFCHDCQEKQGK